MTTLLILVFFFHAIVFLVSALVAVIRFNIDLHRYKQKFDFAGRRRKFIDFLLEQQLNGTPDAAAPDQSREEGEANAG